MPVTVLEVDLHKSLRRLTAMLVVQARARNLIFAVHITGRTPNHVMVDYNHLEQILINLVANAIKFTESGFVIMRVDGVRRHGDRARLAS
jgi:signal transduction histidine kinase